MSGKRNPAVDAFIARSRADARPILARVRAAFHVGCPELEERIKRGVPSFAYKGMLGGMAVFKHHVTFGFWKSRGPQPAPSAWPPRWSGSPRAST